MSVRRHTVEIMNANTSPATAKPPRPGSAEHWAAWLERYGDDYATDTERRAAYRDFRTNLATMQAVFTQEPDPKVGEDRTAARKNPRGCQPCRCLEIGFARRLNPVASPLRWVWK